jgi:hypothetical protein
MALAGSTLLEALVGSLAAASRESSDRMAPAALLWADPTGQWLPVLPALRRVLPAVFTLDKYDPGTRSGPAIWLKCVVDRTLPEPPAAGVIPVLYLPKVSRQDLRAAECPPRLLPLVELQYRGKVWHQTNGREWTVPAFLVSEDGLGLEMAQDRRTEEAMLRVLEVLAEAGVDALRGRRLDSDDFDKLAVSDPVRDLLRWMATPETFEAANQGGRWESFRSVCKGQFGFDPDQAGVRGAGAALANGRGVWETVWQRFCEAPQLYPGISKLLSEPSSGAQSLLALDGSRNPRVNAEEERELRAHLVAVGDLPSAEAAARIEKLDERHSGRREWVWAAMGQSPWVRVLEPLAQLARLAMQPVGGGTLAAAVAAYVDSGWRVDRLAMSALAQLKSEPDRRVVGAAVRALYLPWLTDSARHFQELWRKQESDGRAGVGAVKPEKETCVVFVDGLRYDLGVWLIEKLESRGFSVRLSHRLAPLPTVTATAKPAATPVSFAVEGGATADDFLPKLELKFGWVGAQGQALRKRMIESDIEMLDAGEMKFPAGSAGGGWTECGQIDALGHKVNAELPLHLESEVDRITDRVAELLGGGWSRVRVVTDHGWLLVPGGLPKVELPAYLSGTKWARSAVIAHDAHPAVVTYGWHWNPEVRIVSPPGVASFFAGESYTHGGVSLQECVIPEILVVGGTPAVRASIQSVQWRGMRCRVAVETNDPSLRVDLRLSWKQEDSSIAAAVKVVGAEGEASLVVPDDDRMGSAAFVVLLDAAGTVIDRRTTSVGETV